MNHILIQPIMYPNLSEASKKNAEANILNAEANNRNSQNLEKLILLIERK